MFLKKFKLNTVKWIGDGASGQVFCIESVENQKVAIKVILTDD